MQGDQHEPDVDALATNRIRRLLSKVEESDFERIDPPADLWDQIAASVALEPVVSPREPPSRSVSGGTVVEYRIDANDIVTAVGQSWAEFASDNGAPELAVPPPDRTLWTYFESEETRDVWRLVVTRVRAQQQPAEVPLRCDAPDARRWFVMTISPEPHGGVHFRCVLAFEEPRPPVSLLEPHSQRDDDLQPVPLCSWCGRGQHDSLWLDIEQLVQAARLLELAAVPPISYGICASCRDQMSAEILVPGRAGESTA